MMKSDSVAMRVSSAFLMLASSAQATTLLIFEQNAWFEERARAKAIAAIRGSRQDLDELRAHALEGMRNAHRAVDRLQEHPNSDDLGNALSGHSSESTADDSIPPVFEKGDTAPALGSNGGSESNEGGVAKSAPASRSAQPSGKDTEGEPEGPIDPAPTKDPDTPPHQSAEPGLRGDDADQSTLDVAVPPLGAPILPLVLSALLLQVSEDPLADPGGPYEALAANRTNGGWTFAFDGSGSVPGSTGAPIVSWVWDFGTDTFDGSALNLFKWEAFGALQDDAVVLTGHGSQWRNRVVTRELLQRAIGAVFEATVTPKQTNGHGCWGLKLGNGQFRAADVVHGFYFLNNGRVYALENGGTSDSQAYSADVAYDLRVELKESTGARYLIRESGSPEWVVLRDSNSGSAAEMQRGMVAHSGTFVMDNVRELFAGETITRKVYTHGTVDLTVEDTNGVTNTATVAVNISGDVLGADAGGPYVLRSEDRVGLGWETTFDSGASTGTREIIQTDWILGVTTFDGEMLNTDRWNTARVGQDGQITIQGVGNWTAHAVENEPIARVNGELFEATVTPKQTNAYGIWGLKLGNGQYAPGAIVHGFYFQNNGRVYSLESGASRNSMAYSAGVAYDLRLELKEGAGARYLIRESGTPDWQILDDSGAATDASLHRSMVVYSGQYDFDNLRDVFRGTPLSRTVYRGGPLEVTITDAVGQTATVSAQLETVPPVATADPGGPYNLPETSATPTGLPLSLDASGSTSGPAIVRYEWDFGLETFDGVRLDDRRWVSKQTVQNDALIASGSGSWGSGHVYERQTAYRADRASIKARVRSNGYTLIGFKDASSGASNTNMVYAVYFSNGTLAAYDNGSNVTAYGSYLQNEWYDVRITLHPDAGASYWLRPSGEDRWQLVYASSTGTAVELRRSAVLYNGTATIDDWETAVRGEAPTLHVAGGGSVELTIENAAGQTDSDVATYDIVGDPPAASAGGTVQLTEPGHINGAWDAIFDGTASSDDFGIVSHVWDFGPDPLDGNVVDTDVWTVARTTQSGRLVTTGAGWGSGYAFDRRPIARDVGAFVQARVNSSGNYSMWGLKNTSSTYSYTAMPYAIYFNQNGSIYIYEDGSNRGVWGSYSAGIDYDVRIELKPTGGARYLIRESDATDWTPLYESSYSQIQEMLGGCTVHSGSLGMDDFHRSVSGDVVEYRVRGAGSVALTVTDAAGQTSTDTVDVVIAGEAPVADAGGPYHSPVGVGATLEGSGSTDDFEIFSYVWDFGDGTTGSGSPISHTYSEPGTYALTLTVTDVAGRRDMDTTTVQVDAMVVCVPWQFDPVSASEIPHSLWDGLATRLKAVVFSPTPASELSYTWNYGDGSPPETFATVASKRILEAAHTYTGSPGQLITATVTVHDPVYGDLTDSYPMIIEERDLSVEVNVAIDEGLWYLHKVQEESGTWASYGGYRAGSTASAIQAMEINGHVPSRSATVDPLVDDVVRGLDAMFTYLRTTNIGPQTYGDPDSNSNGIGIGVNSGRPIYEGGMVMDAIAASGTPDRVADTGVAGIAGRTYHNILQDMVDMYSWGQVDSGGYRGGWRYGWNSQADNSACQWAAIGFLGARDAFGLDAPGWVKESNEDWLTYTQASHGGFGYYSPSDGYATTPSGMVQLAWIGVPTSDDRWIRAENRIASAYPWLTWRNSNNVYAWYSFAKAMRLAVPEPVTNLSANGIDWFGDPSQGLARRILDRQETSGSWPDYYGRGFATAWQIIILTPTLFTRPPEAVAGEDILWACELPLEFDACGSYHHDPARVIVQYEWDFDGDGTFDYIGSACSVDHTFVDCPPGGEPLYYTAVLRVTDDNGQSDVDTRAVTIAQPPFAPFAVLDGPYTAWAGIPFSPDASDSFDLDPGDYITLQQWDFDGGDGFDFDLPDVSVDCPPPPDCCPTLDWTYDAVGNYNIGVRVWDAGVLNPPGCTPGVDCNPLASIPDFTTVTVFQNHAPAAHAGGPYTVNECQPLALDASASFDPDGNPLYFTWDLDDDGVFDDATGVAPTHTWMSQGTHTVHVHVTDLALEDVAEATVTVNDLTPTVSLSAWGPTELAVNQQGCFNATVVSSCDEVASIEWDWHYLDLVGFRPSGDTGGAQCHAWTEQGTFVVAVLATDADGDEALATLEVVANPDEAFLQPFELDLEIDYRRRGYLPKTNQHYAVTSLTNVGTTTVQGPLVLAFGDFTPAGTHLVNPDDTLPNGLQYIDFTVALGDNLLEPGEVTAPIRIHWQVVGDGDLFSFVATPYAINSAPVFVTDPITAATEGLPYTYQSVAEDAEGNPLVYGLAEGPAGLTIGSASGLVQWTPGQMDAGDHMVTITASDGYSGGTAAQTFVLTVDALDVAPVFRSTPVTVAVAGAQWCYDIEADDPDGDAVALRLENGPADMALNGNVLCWTPTQQGRSFVELAAFDFNAETPDVPRNITYQDFFLTVLECADPPLITSTPVTASVEGALYEYDVDASVPPGQVVVFELEVAPEGMSIDPGAGLITWSPGQQQAGPRVVKVVSEVSGDPLCRDEQIFEINVAAVNVSPQFTSTPRTSATEGSLYRYHAQAHDADGDLVTFRLDIAPDDMEIIPEVGVIEWMPTQAAAGEFPDGAEVVVAACDPFDACTVQVYTIDIAGLNVVPRIISTPVYGALEGSEYVYAVEAVDDDGDPLAFSLEVIPNDPGASDMTIDPDGVIRWTPSETAAQNNPHPVRVIVSDGVLNAAQTYEVFVVSVNQPPSVTGIPPQIIDEGEILTLVIEASDPDGDPLSFTRVSPIPDGMNVHPETGLIEWTAGCSDAGEYSPISIEVSDGHVGGVVTVEFSVTVNEVNCSPTVTSTPPLDAAVGREYTYDVTAVDPEGQPVSCDLEAAPPGMVIDADCHVTWTPGEIGEFPVRIVVSDEIARTCGTDPSACQEFTIHVAPCLSPPHIASVPSQTAAMGNQYTYQLLAVFGEPDPPTYELPLSPVGMNVDSNGLLTWEPTADQVGFHDVSIGVYTGLTECRADQMFTIEVIACTDPPTVTTTPVTAINEAGPYEYDVDANPGRPGDSLTFELADAPAAMSIDPVSGVIGWAPSHDDIGEHVVRIVVTADRLDCRAEQAYSLTVSAYSYFPTFTSTCPAVAYVDEPYQCDVNADDRNGDELRFALISSMTEPIMPPPDMTIGEQTGLIHWTPTVADVGAHRVGVRVEEVDGPGFEEQEFDLEVLVNAPPVITSHPPLFAVAAANYVYDVDAVDADLDSLTYGLEAAPAAMAINPTDGVVQWAPTSDDVGQHDVIVAVNDGHGGADVQPYTLAVLEAGTNSPPVITSAPPAMATPDCPYIYSVKSTDPNGDAVLCSLPDDFPEGMTIDPASCLIEWTPTSDQLGERTVHVRLTEISIPDTLAADQIYAIAVDENTDPVMISVPVAVVTVGSTYLYDAAAVDGEDDTLVYALDTAPEGMTINPNTGLIAWTPSDVDVDPASGYGQYDVIVSVDDGRCGETTQNFRVFVYADTDPPVVSLSAPVAINPPVQTFPINVTAEDDVGVVSLTLTVNGEAVPISREGVAYYDSAGPGLYTIVATATDAAGNIAHETTQTMAVADAESVAPELAIITPEDGSTVTQPVDIVGTVHHDNLAYWTLSYGSAGSATDEYTQIGYGTTEVTEGVLGAFDPSTLLNGLYNIRLYSLDYSGTYYELLVSYLVDGNMKVGNFTISYTDMQIPVAGIPMTVKRTYDSRNKSMGDFGVGWTLDVASIEIEEGTPLHEGWHAEFVFAGLLPAFLIIPTKAHMVNVRWPGAKNQAFMMNAPIRAINVFEYLVGVPFELEPVAGSPELANDMDGLTFQVFGSNLGQGPFSGRAGSPYDPSIYELTTADGTGYNFAGEGRTAKLKSMRDRNGNTLNITQDGIMHSSGKAILFDRDEQGRITAITDPNGNVVRYSYDDRGDLTAVTDAEQNATSFAYNHEHGLTDIVDPLGRRGVRNEYDDDGRLVAGIDANGNRVEFARDINARQEAVTDRLGNTTVYYYDDRGNVVLKVDPYGNQTDYEYDERDNLITETDCAGRVKTFTYDDNDNTLSETNCSGGVTVYTRDAHGNVLTKTDPEGNVTTYEYDADGNLVRELAPDGGMTVHAYNDQGRKLSTTNPLGYTEYFEYDSIGRLTAEVDLAGARTEYAYDDNGNRISETKYRTLPDGSTEPIVTRFVYDANNRQIETIDPYGFSSYTEYDDAGQMVARTDALGRVTRMHYGLGGVLVATESPDGSFASYEYDAEGHRISSTDRNGYETRYAYDKLGRMTKTIHPDATPEDNADNPYTETEYDCVGRTLRQWDERRNATEYAYTCDPNTQIVTDTLGHSTTHEYDRNGNRVSVTDALGRNTQYVYDGMNRLLRTIYDDGTVSETYYDLAGNKIAEFDQGDKLTRYQHDPMGRLTAVILSSEGRDLVTSYTYDELGNQRTQTDAEGRTTTFEYDKLSRRTKRTLPLGQVETSTYDAAGARTAKTDFNGDTIAYEYDDNGRLVKETTPDGVETTYDYQPGGERTSAGGVVTEYDERGRVLRVTNPDASMLEYTYDQAGNRTSVTTTTGGAVQTTSYLFDELNRLAEVHAPDSGVTRYTYDGIGNRESVTLPNGVITEYEYDSLNRLTKLTNKRPDDSVISSYEYTLGPAGNRLRVDEITPDGEPRVVEYDYDDLYRLIGENIDEPGGSPNPDQAIRYTYDDVGNRLAKTVADMNGVTTTSYSYDGNDRLLDEIEVRDSGVDPPAVTSQTAYNYNANGTTLTRTRGAARDEYTYDYRNRLLAAHNETEGLSDVTFTYDTDGIRTGKTVAGQGSTTYLLDKNRRYAQVLADTTVADEGATEVTSYVYGDDLLSMSRADTGASYYLYDGQMSTRQLTGALAGVTDTYTYDAFGIDIHHTGITPNFYKYTGEQYDPNLGFYYLRARYYVQAIGRFLSMDFSGGSQSDPASLHRYLYANADPLINIDPSGLSALTMYSIILKCFILPMYCIVGALQCIAISLLWVAALVGFGGTPDRFSSMPIPSLGPLETIPDLHPLAGPMLGFLRTIQKNVRYVLDAIGRGASPGVIMRTVVINCVKQSVSCLESATLGCGMMALGLKGLLPKLVKAMVANAKCAKDPDCVFN